MGASKEMHCKVIYRWSRGCWDRERFIIFLVAVLTVPAGRGSLELLDSREMSVHKCCGKNGEKRRTGQRERGKSSRKKQFSHTKPFTRTWKEQIYPTHHPRGEQADTHKTLPHLRNYPQTFRSVMISITQHYWVLLWPEERNCDCIRNLS